jgi:hypothetical protein
VNRNISTKRSRDAIELPKNRKPGPNVTLWCRNYIECKKGLLSVSMRQPIDCSCHCIANFWSSGRTARLEFAKSYIAEYLNSYRRDPTISSETKLNHLSSAAFTPLFLEPSVPILQDSARKPPTALPCPLYTLFRLKFCGLNLAANLPHKAVWSTRGTIPLVVGLPTLELWSTHSSGGISQLNLTVEVLHRIIAPLVFPIHSSGGNRQLNLTVDVLYGIIFPPVVVTHSSGVVYPLFRRDLLTLNLAADFSLVLATHSSGAAYPLFRYGNWTLNFSGFPTRGYCARPYPLFRCGLPTLQARFIDFEFGCGFPARPRYPLFRCGLPTLQEGFRH